jgi:hypothetical protein
VCVVIIIIIVNSYGSGLVACSNSELLLKLLIGLDIWQDSLDEGSARRKATEVCVFSYFSLMIS